MTNEKGASLIEVILAVVLIVGVVAYLSLLLPKTSQSEVLNHQRLLATNLATAKIEDLKKQPFDWLASTPKNANAALYFGATNVGDPGCDCSQASVDFAQFPIYLPAGAYSNLSPPMGGTTYTVVWCINDVAVLNSATTTWTPHCPGVVNINTKFIRVHVGWGPLDPATDKYQYSLDQEAIVSRF